MPFSNVGPQVIDFVDFVRIGITGVGTSVFSGNESRQAVVE